MQKRIVQRYRSTRRRRVLPVLAVLLAAVLPLACGGDDGGGTVPTVCLSYGGTTSPATGQVVVREASSGNSCDVRVLEVVVTNLADVFATSFTLTFDSAAVDFQSVSSTATLLASGGATVQVLVDEQPGTVTVGLTRLGVGTGVGVSGSAVLATVFFRRVAAAAGTTTLGVPAGEVFGSETPPVAKAGLTWSGGTFTTQ